MKEFSFFRPPTYGNKHQRGRLQKVSSYERGSEMRGNVLFKNRKQNTRVSFSKSNRTNNGFLGLHDFILKVSKDKAFAFLRENSFLILNNFWILSADFNGKSLQKLEGSEKI